MANRVNPLTQIETLSGNILASTYFDNNIGPAMSALNDASLGYANAIATDTGSANNYIVSCAFGVPSAYNVGFLIFFIPANTNTGASVITVNGVTPAQSIVDFAGNALIPGAIQAGILTTCIYVSGAFRLLYTAVPGALITTLVNSASGTNTVTLNCGGYLNLNITVDSSGGPTNSSTVLLLQNVMRGAHIDLVWRSGASTQLFFFSGSCTDQGGFTIPHITQWSAAGVELNLVTTGQNNVPLASLLVGAYFYNTNNTAASGIRFGQFAYH